MKDKKLFIGLAYNILKEEFDKAFHHIKLELDEQKINCVKGNEVVGEFKFFKGELVYQDENGMLPTDFNQIRFLRILAEKDELAV